MKKIIVIILFILIAFFLYKKEGTIIIPNESIRVRIIANSNNVNDLLIKKKVRNELENELYTMVKDTKNIEEARDTILGEMSSIEKVIDNTIKEDYKISYGTNYFPKKIYRGIVYPAGNYESLVVTLGEGIGENWWCVLFPPLCMIDENTITNDVEYQFLIEKILKN